MLRRILLSLFLFPLALNAAFAQGWPTRPIQTLVPQSPGSALDIVTRAVMEQVSAQLGQPIVIENRTGAGNTIAMAAVARAEPDGYTILANSSTHSLVPVTYSTLAFDTFRDLTPIIPLGNTPLVMVVSSSKGYKNVADFVAAAKEKRGAMNYSSGGVGSITHLAMEAFRRGGLRSGPRPIPGSSGGAQRGTRGTRRLLLLPAYRGAALSSGWKAAGAGCQRFAARLGFTERPNGRRSGLPRGHIQFLGRPVRTVEDPDAHHRAHLSGDRQGAARSDLEGEILVRLGFDAMPLDRPAFAKLIRDEFILNTKVAKAAGVAAN